MKNKTLRKELAEYVTKMYGLNPDAARRAAKAMQKKNYDLDGEDD